MPFHVYDFSLWFQVVAIDRKNGSKLMSFQELSSRGRGSKDTSITLDSIKVWIRYLFPFSIPDKKHNLKKEKKKKQIIQDDKKL